METIEARLRRILPLSGDITTFHEDDERPQPAVDATFASDIFCAAAYRVYEYNYQSIEPLKGKYASDPSWEELPGFIEKYWQEIGEQE